LYHNEAVSDFMSAYWKSLKHHQIHYFFHTVDLIH